MSAAIERYLAAMICRYCAGKGKVGRYPCARCGGDGSSEKFKALQHAATSGLRHAR